MRKLIYIQCMLFLLTWHLSAQVQPEEGSLNDTIRVNADLFEQDEPMVLTMKFDIKAFQRNKFKGEYMPAELTYLFNDSIEIVKEVRLKARGNFRRNFCTMPPIWLNIRKADIENKMLQEVVKMKVVTHCNGGKASGTYVMKEFLAYQIYNILSPYSFRATLVQMKYIDTGRKGKVTENWAFMIEPEEMLSKRLDLFLVENDNLSMKQMLPEHMDRLAMFNYLIGNADFSVTGRHNLKIMGLKEINAQGFIPVPYDFDYSGIVNAFYAEPGENLGIESVTDRYYLGACREIEEYQSTIDYFNSKKDEIMDLILTFPYLDMKDKEPIIEYIEEFFIQTSYSDFILNDIKRTCR